MEQADFRRRVQELRKRHEKLVTRKNYRIPTGNGVFDRYAYPVLTANTPRCSGATTSIGKRIRT